MAYCMYLRKSRKDIEDESRGAEETLARHRRILTDLANKLKLSIEEVYMEVVSGETLAARPEAQRLLADVEAGKWQGVLVTEVERLARGETIDQGIVAQAFKYTDTKIITPTKTYDPSDEYDEEFFEFSLFMSRREYKSIRRRMDRGRVSAVEEGKYIGSVPPYGYRRIAIHKGFSLEPVPAEANVVKDIFSWYVDGLPLPNGTHRRIGISLIARRLNDLNVPTRNGGVWVTGTVRDILKNHTYTGNVRWNRRKVKKVLVDGERVATRPRTPPEEQIIVRGLHQPIISDEVFERAQQIFEANRPTPVQKSNEVKNPFAGLFVCGKCGRKMVRRPYSNGQPPYLICSCNACDNVSSELSVVEVKLIDMLAEWLRQYEISIESGTPAPVSTATELNALERIKLELMECEKQGGNLFSLVERGVYSDELFIQRRKALNEDIERLKQEKNELHAAIAAKDAHNAVASILTPKVRQVIDTYADAATAQAKNDMLKEILEKIVYTRSAGGRWQKDKLNFTLELFPKWPKGES